MIFGQSLAQELAFVVRDWTADDELEQVAEGIVAAFDQRTLRRRAGRFHELGLVHQQ